MPEFKLILNDEEVEILKIRAAKQKVRPQSIARDAFRAGMAGSLNGGAVPVPNAPTTDKSDRQNGIQDHATPVISSLRQNLMAAKAAIEMALGTLDEQEECAAAVAGGQRMLRGIARSKGSGEEAGAIADATPVGRGRAK